MEKLMKIPDKEKLAKEVKEMLNSNSGEISLKFLSRYQALNWKTLGTWITRPSLGIRILQCYWGDKWFMYFVTPS